MRSANAEPGAEPGAAHDRGGQKGFRRFAAPRECRAGQLDGSEQLGEQRAKRFRREASPAVACDLWMCLRPAPVPHHLSVGGDRRRREMGARRRAGAHCRWRLGCGVAGFLFRMAFIERIARSRRPPRRKPRRTRCCSRPATRIAVPKDAAASPTSALLNLAFGLMAEVSFGLPNWPQRPQRLSK